MPRNATGTYTLPVSSFVANTTIKSADVNSDFSDIATALTQSLATTGVSSMTGPLKLAAGSAGAPSLALAVDLTTGWYNSAAGAWTFVSTGTSIITLGPTSVAIGNLTVTNLTVTGSFSVAANRIVGEVVDYCGTSAPALWLFAFGQAVSRATYVALFTALGTAFGAGDGVTTFNLPDYRGRVGVGKDDMGGVAANRITNAGSGIVGTTLGANGGSETNTLTTATIPAHTHINTLSDPGHTHGASTFGGDSTSAGGARLQRASNFSAGFGQTTDSSITGVSITNASVGSGNAHANVQPTLIVNKMIYAGV